MRKDIVDKRCLSQGTYGNSCFSSYVGTDTAEGQNAGKRKSTVDSNIHPSGWANKQKSPLMISCFLLLWTFSLVLYGPRLWQILFTSKTIIEAILLSAFSIFLIIFWLLAAYFIAAVSFSFLSKPLLTPPDVLEEKFPEVAILYTTCNDFSAEAAASCLNQNYQNFHLFLLDDSSKEEIRAEVDAFHAAHPEETTIVRRSTRTGFKPGALNYVLRGVAAKYPFFAVVDADEKIPTDFLRQTIAYMHNSNIAFVQANHALNPQQKATFARDIGPTILPFWDVHCRTRNRYGFVVYVGHGAVVRRSAWEAVGGFPEVITEDLAFSALLAEKGMRGLFLEKVVCYEDFPTTYPAFKRQHERYITGTTQVMCKYLGRLLRSQRISLTEKIDFLLWCSPLYIPALCLLFVVLCSLCLTVVFGNWSILTISIFEHQFVLPPVRILDERFASLCSWDFQLVSVFGAFSPAFACLALGLKGKLRAGRVLFLSTAPYLSLMLLSWRGILRYLLTRRTPWPPTGEKLSTFPKGGFHTLKSSTHRGYSGCFGTWYLERIWEIGIGGVLAIASLISFNFAFFAVSCCLLVGAYIEVFGWEGRFAHFASIGCFALILLQMVLNLALLSHSPGLVPLVFSVHF